MEAALGVVGAGVLAAGALCWRLAQGPIDLPALTPHVEAQLAGLRADRPVDIGQVRLIWVQERRSLELRAEDVTLLSADRQVVSHTQAVVLGLDPAQLLIGRMALKRAVFVGGALTVVMAEDGSAAIAFGPPGAPADVLVPAPPPGETWRQRAERLLSGLEEAFTGLGAASGLQELRVEALDVTVDHRASGGLWTAEDAKFRLLREGDALRLALEAQVRPQTGEGDPIPASLSISSDTAFHSAVIEARLQQARLAEIGPQLALGPLTALDAPVSLVASAALDRTAGLTRVEGELAFGAGVFRLPGGEISLDGGRLRGRYAHEDDVLAIEEATVSGQRTRLRGAGEIGGLKRLFGAAGGRDPAIPFELAMTSAAIEAPGVLEGPVEVADLQVKGAASAQTQAIEIERASFRVDRANVGLSGRLWWTKEGGVRPGVSLQGAAEGTLSTRDVLRFWPIEAASVTRRWLTTAVKAAAIQDVRFAVATPPGARLPLPAAAVDVRFRYADAEVAYLSSMPPITEGAGEAHLTGRSFSLGLDKGRIGALTLAEGRVEIPQFERGARHTYAARAEGPARAMVDLLRQAPIGLDGKLPADPATIVGQGVVRFALTRPNVAAPRPEDIGFTIDGRLEGVGGRSPDGMTVSDWRLRVEGDDRALTFAGPLRLDGAPLDLTWTERLKGGGDTRSQIVAAGTLDAAQLTRMGFPIADYVTGPIGVRARAAGEGLDAKTAVVRLDLADARVTVPLGYWTKVRGVPADLRFEAVREPQGGYRLNNLALDGQGVTARGFARFADGGDLLEARLEDLEIEGRIDGRLTLRKLESGVLAMDARGPLFSLAPLLGEGDPVTGAQAAGRKPGPVTAELAEAPRPAQPVEGLIRAERLRLAGGVDLSDGRVSFATNGEALTALSLQGDDPAGAPLRVAITPQTQGPARVRFETKDAGFAWRGLTGQENVIGGSAEGAGAWVAGTGGGPSTGRVNLRMRDFQVVRVPAMARLLSSVSSLQGLADALNGGGIAFTSLEAPVAYTDGEVRLGEARMAGPSLGLTARGRVDLEHGRLEIDGVVVPSYTLNSMLGAVPVLGDLLTSRRGEGVVGITYTMRGPAEDARVGVNPLSALTPGILRRIFETPPPPAGSAEAPTPSGG